MVKKALLLLLAGSLLCLPAVAQAPVTGRVVDATTGEPVVGAAITQGKNWALTDSLGVFRLKTGENSPITITSMGYKTAKAALVSGQVFRLQPDVLALQEVVVTAQEERGVTATSVIGKDAIEHIQPSSIRDILELLPGGRAVDPNLASPQVANLRSAASVSTNYATSALGTAIVIDGRPVENNANLQSSPAYSSLGSSFVNYGTDLRTITTEDIESVEVVRGIASVEYGDLTSGLMIITRKRGGNTLRARFKADMSSKLFYVGKDFEWKTFTLNVGANYLNSMSDPRNPRQNYKRFTGTVRMGKTWKKSLEYVLNASLDYTGSFDDLKSDENLDFGTMGPVETYFSSYNKLDAGVDFSIKARDNETAFRSWITTLSFTAEIDRISRWKYVVNGSEQAYSVATEPGEWDAIILPVRYESTLQVKGLPVYAYLQSAVSFKWGRQKLKGGIQWTLDKNLGEGTVFDITRPFSSVSSARPRPYYAIPSNHELSLFAEESGSKTLGRGALEWSAGVRMSMLLGAGKQYQVNGKPYVDPRANVRYNFPSVFLKAHRLDVGIYAGAGLHTKFPTMDMLYPEPVYGDIQVFNYWPVETQLRRSYMYVYKEDPTNYTLAPARNFKWEIGADASWNGFHLAVDYFWENMNSGFRTSSRYGRYVVKRYDGSGIDKSTLTGPPDVTSLPWQTDTLLQAYGITTNGSQTLKQGIEFTFTSPRIKAINTRITANGAWFVTKNTNSAPLYYVPSAIVSGSRYNYVGYYEVNDGSTYTQLNTNIMLDTQFPRLGLILSVSCQTSWFSNHYPIPRSTVPISYLDKDLVEHPYTEADAQDPVLRYLILESSSMDYNYLVPFATYFNLKATKKFYQEKIAVSLFVNRLLAIAPDYYMNGAYVRRSTTPYFGMEIDFKI